MCTVTLVPDPNTNNGFILTSNRDEASERETLPPEIYEENGVKMMYPKDKLAGGTWIGISEKRRVICLLNGAFEDHRRKASYRTSRGVVVKDLLAAEDFRQAIEKYELTDIEPFTLILAERNVKPDFLELVWDGAEKHVRTLKIKEHLWSSAPLYTPEMHRQRLRWFREFLQKEKLNTENIWEFHHSAGAEDINTAMIMDRGVVRTQSVTQVTASEEGFSMLYKDIRNGFLSKKDFRRH